MMGFFAVRAILNHLSLIFDVNISCLCVQGMMVSVLKLPMNLAGEGHTGYDATSITINALPVDDQGGT